MKILYFELQNLFYLDKQLLLLHNIILFLMDVQLYLYFSDSLILSSLEKNKSQEDILKDEKPKDNIIEQIRDSFCYLKSKVSKDCYDIEIKGSHKNDDNNIHVNIKSTEKLKKKIEAEIDGCTKKELKLLEQKKKLQTLYDGLIIDENLFEKKLIQLTNNKDQIYFFTINKIVECVLDYKKFSKEIEDTQKTLIKYRESNLISLCFKIYLIRIKEIILYIHSKHILFLNNENLFNILISKYQKILNIIFNELYEEILQNISDKDIYINNKEDYNEKLLLVKELCNYFPLLKYYDNIKQEIKILNEEQNIVLKGTESNYLKVKRINFQIPKDYGLDTPFDNFKKKNSIKKGIDIALKRSLLIYQKFNFNYLEFLYNSFLYE